MKRAGDLFHKTAEIRNLWRAWRQFRRGKRNRPSVRRFEAEADREIIKLSRDLEQKNYSHGGYHLFFINDPKIRLISAASVRDRIVHHAVHRVIAPFMDRGLIDTTYACLPGRGSHRAVIRFLGAVRRYRFALLMDIAHYFLSIDINILMQIMRKKIKDDDFLWLLRLIADSGRGIYRRRDVSEKLNLPPGYPPYDCGLPIGNLTSQWWGNHYLSGFDHFLKRELKIPHVQRYMDDTALFSDSRRRLAEAKEAAVDWLMKNRRLRIKNPSVQPRRTSGAFIYLGYHVSRSGIRPSRRMLVRMRRRLRYLAGHGRPEDFYRSLSSYRGLTGFAAIRQ